MLRRIRSVATDRISDWSPHTYRSRRDGGPTRVGVSDARTHPGDRTFLVAQGFRSWVEPFEMQRFALIATILRARLVVVETPGLGLAGSRLSAPEYRGLRGGNFGPLGARMFEAATALLDDLDDGRLSFLGYSMGASTATAMACNAAAQGWAIDALVLVEPVGLRRWTLPVLLGTAWHQRRHDRGYLSANDTVPGATPCGTDRGDRPATNRKIDQLALGAALRHGGVAEDLRAALSDSHRAILVTGDKSTLPGDECVRTVAALQEQRSVVHHMTVPGHHGFWHSLPAVADMARRLAALLDPCMH